MARPERKHIIVGLSGGVDSSVTALLLKQQGYQVEGVFMKNWEGENPDSFCPAAVDMADAAKVCERLDIPFTAVNFSEKYWEKVFTRFLDELKQGLTPNPDILCNREIKFRAFLDYALTRGADAIATGHYARIDDASRLLKAVDPLKDQSYFLHALSREQLAMSLFPLGTLQKTAVRKLALEAGLPTHSKKDSTGICFIGEKRFSHFISQYLPQQPGPIATPEGEVVGEHDGLMYYTLGQRQGIRIGGMRGKNELPWYVLDKDTSRNTLIVGQGDNHPRLYSQSLIAADMHWISGTAPDLPLLAHAKTRYRQSDQACMIREIKSVPGMPLAHEITFADPQRAVTPGQSVVFYDGEICLGGGTILRNRAREFGQNCPV